MSESRVFEFIKREQWRQNRNIELIASENFVSDNVLAAMGSCLTSKYAEGYPGRRYYGGCAFVDELETYCQDKWKEAFQTDYHVNVQPHSGSSANLAAYMAVLKPGDTILSMSLANGGHLTHGSPVNFSGKLYNIVEYGVDEDGFIDYNELEEKILKYNPKLVLAGASAYPREILFSKIGKFIQSLPEEARPIFMCDISHVAGLIVAGDHDSPFGYADIITTTTHKTLRSARGAMIFCKPELAKKIDSAVFPGSQGGPLLNMIAGKAVGAEEACTEEYKEYIHQVCKNAKAMAKRFEELGYDLVTGGTSNHMMLIDFSKTHPNLTGKEVQDELDRYFITLNKNCVPNEHRSPMQTSGVRIGTPAMTTKGYKEKDFIEVADLIDSYIKAYVRRT